MLGCVRDVLGAAHGVIGVIELHCTGRAGHGRAGRPERPPDRCHAAAFRGRGLAAVSRGADVERELIGAVQHRTRGRRSSSADRWKRRGSHRGWQRRDMLVVVGPDGEPTDHRDSERRQGGDEDDDRSSPPRFVPRLRVVGIPVILRPRQFGGCPLSARAQSWSRRFRLRPWAVGRQRCRCRRSCLSSWEAYTTSGNPCQRHVL
jgi:hypothetical protein